MFNFSFVKMPGILGLGTAHMIHHGTEYVTFHSTGFTAICRDFGFPILTTHYSLLSPWTEKFNTSMAIYDIRKLMVTIMNQGHIFICSCFVFVVKIWMTSISSPQFDGNFRLVCKLIFINFWLYFYFLMNKLLSVLQRKIPWNLIERI